MRGKHVAILLACLAVVVGGAMSPAVAKPQLSMMGGAALTPQLDTGNLPGGKKAIDQARKHQKETKERAKEADELTKDEPGVGSGLPAEMLSPAQVISAFQQSPAQAAKSLTGAWVKVTGVCVDAQDKGDVIQVLLAPQNGSKTAPIFVFRLPRGSNTPNKGQLVELHGTFAFRGKVDGLPNDMYFVDGKDAAGQSVAPTAPEKPKEPFAGWRFAGSVAGKGSATGVFVRGEDTVYAQPGDKLDGGVKVVTIEAGEATLSDNGSKSIVVPW